MSFIILIIFINLILLLFSEKNKKNKNRALKNAIIALLAGETMPRVLMTVIRLSYFKYYYI
jgi:vesicle coat complex subunit